MTIYRLSGGVGPIDGDDPRTFTGIWNDMANQVESSFQNLTDISERIDNLGIEDLEGVDITAPSAGEVLQYDGVNWVNAVPVTEATFNATVDYSSSGPYAINFTTQFPGRSSNLIRVVLVGGGGGGGGGQGDTTTVAGDGGAGGQTTFTLTGSPVTPVTILAPGGAGGAGAGSATASPATSSPLVVENGGAGGQCSNQAGARSMGTDGRGGAFVQQYVDITGTNTATLTVGAAGTGGTGQAGANGANGASGYCYIEYIRAY